LCLGTNVIIKSINSMNTNLRKPILGDIGL